MMSQRQLQALAAITSRDATSASDQTIDAACRRVVALADAAGHANHLGEARVLRAAAADDLDAALRAVLPHCAEAPADVIAAAFHALAKARGQTILSVQKVA